jgi:hypothetical protein
MNLLQNLPAGHTASAVNEIADVVCLVTLGGGDPIPLVRPKGPQLTGATAQMAVAQFDRRIAAAGLGRFIRPAAPQEWPDEEKFTLVSGGRAVRRRRPIILHEERPPVS